VSRWLVVPIGLGLAAATAWLLLTGGPPIPEAPAPTGAHDEIGEPSRDELREILREAGKTP
jgi:hypothetical protein